MPTPVPAMTAPPTVPVRGDRVNFGTQSQNWTLWEKNYKFPETIALANNVYANAVEAASSAGAAAASAGAAASAYNAAQAAASSALAASNFKGAWSTLVGALAVPACVKHNGRFWLLLNNLLDVTAAQPGVSAAWTALDTGSSPSAVIDTNTTAVVGVRYRIAGACTLTIPAGLLQGDFIGVSLMEGVSGAYINFGATRFQGKDVGLMLLNTKLLSLPMFYENTTLGLCR